MLHAVGSDSMQQSRTVTKVAMHLLLAGIFRSVQAHLHWAAALLNIRCKLFGNPHGS